MSTPTTRRRFLTTAAAIAGAPMYVPQTVFGANDRINIAQIGFNWIGGSHLGSLLGRQDVQYVAACEVHATRLKTAADRIGLPAASRYRDFRELLERPDLDAVVIAVPDHWHATMSIAAAKAGKDIYCEKPASLTIDEGRQMVKAVRRYGRVFQTGSQQRSEFGGNFRRAVELVRNGVIGELREIEIDTGDPPRPCDLPAEQCPPEVDWNLWVGPSEMRPYHSQLADKMWRPFTEYCGGGLADMGAHHFDIAQWAMGIDKTGAPMTAIYNGSTRHANRVALRYDSGVVMHHGSRDGNIVFHGSKGKVFVDRSFIRTDPGPLLNAPFAVGDLRLGPGGSHHSDWIDAMRTRRRPVADVEIGHRTATVCHVFNICYRLKRDLKWDPVTERFVGDESANRLLSRAKREPWSL